MLQLVTDEQFVLIHQNLIDERVKNILSQRKNFLIIAQADSAKTTTLSANFGVRHIVSFPYTSKSLVAKINELMT
jgi:DNA-directed RNA polymerase